MKNRLSKVQAAYENALENVENLHVNISDGNKKVGSNPICITHPGHGLR